VLHIPALRSEPANDALSLEVRFPAGLLASSGLDKIGVTVTWGDGPVSPFNDSVVHNYPLTEVICFDIPGKLQHLT
jgi:hypothetical protein